MTKRAYKALIDLADLFRDMRCDEEWLDDKDLLDNTIPKLEEVINDIDESKLTEE